MATFGAGFIGDLLKSAHQTGAKETSVKDIKDITTQLRDITKSLSEKSEFLTADLDYLNNSIEYLSKVRKEIEMSSDKDTSILQDIVTQVEVTTLELQNIIHEISAKGSFKPKTKNNESDVHKKVDSLFPYLQTISLIIPSITKSINVARQAIMEKMDKVWIDLTSKVGFTSNKLIVMSKEISASNTLNSNMLKDLKGMSIQASFKQKERDTKSSYLFEFISNKVFGKITSIFNVVGLIFSNLKRLMITFFITVLPWVLLIAAIVVLTIAVLYLVWKHFGETIKKFWNYIKEYVVAYLVMAWNIAKEILEWIWEAAKTAWEILKDLFNIVDAIFSGDYTGAIVIIGKLMDRIVQFIFKTFEKIFNIFDHFLEFMMKLPIIGPVFGWIHDYLMPIARTVFESIMWMFEALKDLKSFGAKIQVAWDYYTKNIFDPLFEWVKGFWTTLWGGLKETVTGVISNIGDALNPFNWFAAGGEVSKPVKGVVGEAGPEAIIPLSGGGESKLSKTLIEFFDYYLPFLKPTVDFLWNSFKPFLPILESVMEAIYNVVYGIISGMSNLPGWLGGNVFKDLLGKLSKPGFRATGNPESPPEKNSVFAKILEVDTSSITKSRLAVIGPNQRELQSIFTDIKAQSESVERASQGVSSTDTSFLIRSGFIEMSKKIDQAVGDLAGTIAANANKAPVVDPAYELSKMLSRGQLGGKI